MNCQSRLESTRPAKLSSRSISLSISSAETLVTISSGALWTRNGIRTAPQFLHLGPNAPALRLCLLRRIGEVMLAVTDPSDEAPTPKPPSSDGESGRGLQIVGALSYIWGWSPIEGNGKAVWAVLKSSS